MDSDKGTYDVFSNKFSQDIFLQKYSLNGQETWADLTKRVVTSVCGQLLSKEDQEEIFKIILERKFIPGGRYLYASGRPFHQVNNCFLFRAEDSREGWAEVASKATAALMSGGGIGVDYSALRSRNAPIKRTGGFSTGPIALMHITNEAGRYVMQGGARRSAIWAGLNWAHGDIAEFMKLKDYSDKLKAIKESDFNFPAPMELTNISVIYDTEFFIAYEDKKHPKHKLAKEVWTENCKQAFSTAEPGMSFNFRKDNESLRNACCIPAYATVLTPTGISILDNIKIGDTIWSGKAWTKVLNKWSKGVQPVYKYRTTTGYFLGTEDHKIVENSIKIEVKDAESIDWALGPTTSPEELDPQDIMDGLVIGDGGIHKASNNLVGLYIGTKDGDYFNSEIKTLIGKYRPGISDTFYEISTTVTPQELARTFDREVPERFFFGSDIKKKGFLRGLFTANGSISGNRVSLKQASKLLIQQVQEMLSSLGIHSYITTNKEKLNLFSNGEYLMKESYDLNITSGRTIFRDTIGFIQNYKQTKIIEGNPPKYKTSNIKSIEFVEETEVFDIMVDDDEHVFWSGGCLISNCEVVSEDDSDKCNLGTIWINRIADKDELRHICKYATKFLICGGIYSDVPTEKVKEVGGKNNRIGLGLGGIHEWLMLRGEDYEVTPELHSWLSVYEQESDSSAFITARTLGVAVPKGVRAVAPTGTIGILAETTTGIEPLFCKAYKRRYLKGNVWMYQYVVDGSVKRLQAAGVSLEQIKDSYDLTFRQRVKFQADVQNYVDMSISSTCNLPAWGSDTNNIETLKKNSDTLLRYAKRLRGFTCYPEGARGGQPLIRVDIAEALANEGVTYEEREDSCLNGVCGI